MGYLQERNGSKTVVLLKSHPSMDDGSQKIETWSILHNLQVAEQVQECLF